MSVHHNSATAEIMHMCCMLALWHNMLQHTPDSQHHATLAVTFTIIVWESTHRFSQSAQFAAMHTVQRRRAPLRPSRLPPSCWMPPYRQSHWQLLLVPPLLEATPLLPAALPMPPLHAVVSPTHDSAPAVAAKLNLHKQETTASYVTGQGKIVPLLLAMGHSLPRRHAASHRLLHIAALFLSPCHNILKRRTERC